MKSLESLTDQEHDRFKTLCDIHGESESDAVVKMVRFWMKIHATPGLHDELRRVEVEHGASDGFRFLPMLTQSLK